MKNLVAASLSALLFGALLAAPAMARDRDDFRPWRDGNGWHQFYRAGERHEFLEHHPRWAWSQGEWREHHDRDDRWRWRDADDWFHRGFDRR
ncbi:MAG TPA: hypothetical protein VFB33_16690 [Candidatus Binataceae bacterium]|jgi:hypothetical protein|nr:hypothetical protein [Candidatus Binataceae bacterium]